MAEPKDEVHLNQTFYGPSIPPSQTSQTHTQQSPAAPASRKFNAYTLLCISFKIFTIILIIVGIIVLTLWLIFQPQSLKAYAEDASLTTFSLSGPGNNTLSYKLYLKVSFRNPNKKYSFYYEQLHAQAFYDGHQFGSVGFPRLFQHRKSTFPVNVSFVGRGNVVEDSVKQNFYREMAEGFFYVSVKFYTSVRLKMILIKSAQYKPDVDCYLRLPVPSNATSLAAGFKRTQCDVNNFS